MDQMHSGEVEAGCLAPSPVLWLDELQQANRPLAPARLWRQVHQVAQHRGTARTGLDWPGQVHIPSPVAQRLLNAQQVKLPKRWCEAIPVAQHARVLAVMAAWESQRHIYRFTERTATLVKQCSVQAPLKASSFETMSARAVYIELGEASADGDGAPIGFFVALDQVAPGRLELVFLVDRAMYLEVHSLPLDGRTLDEVASERLRDARREADVYCPVEAHVREAEQLWHWMVSALLMTSLSEIGADLVDDQLDDDPFRPTRAPWLAWEVGGSVDGYLRQQGPGLVAQWCVPTRRESIRLILQHDPIDWRAFAATRAARLPGA